MKNLVLDILDSAKVKGADYADLRIVRRKMEEIEVKNGRADGLTYDEDIGFGIRVLSSGAWGFACSSKITKKEMESVLGKALKIARASARAKREDISFPSASPVVDHYETPCSVNPFDVPPETKLGLLLDVDEMVRREKKVKISEAFMGSYQTEKTFASTEGSFIDEKIVECGAGIFSDGDRGRGGPGPFLPELLPGQFCNKRLRMD